MLLSILTHFMARPWILFNEDDGQGGGSPDPGDPPAVPAGIQGIIDRNAGDAIAAINQLMAENARLRQQRQDLRQRVPRDGQTVLDAEQAATWAAISEAGITADRLAELQQAATERDQLRTERDDLARRQTIADAAALAGYRPSVLERLAADVQIEIAGEGDERIAYVMDGDTRTPLADYAGQTWADFIPALTITDAGRAGNGTPYPPQGSGRAPQPQRAAVATLTKLYSGGQSNG